MAVETWARIPAATVVVLKYFLVLYCHDFQFFLVLPAMVFISLLSPFAAIFIRIFMVLFFVSHVRMSHSCSFKIIFSPLLAMIFIFFLVLPAMVFISLLSPFAAIFIRIFMVFFLYLMCA